MGLVARVTPSFIHLLLIVIVRTKIIAEFSSFSRWLDGHSHVNEPLYSQFHPGFLNPVLCATWWRASWTFPQCLGVPSLSCCPPSQPTSWSTTNWWSSAQRLARMSCTATVTGSDAQRWRWLLRIRISAGLKDMSVLENYTVPLIDSHQNLYLFLAKEEIRMKVSAGEVLFLHFVTWYWKMCFIASQSLSLSVFLCLFTVCMLEKSYSWYSLTFLSLFWLYYFRSWLISPTRQRSLK